MTAIVMQGTVTDWQMEFAAISGELTEIKQVKQL